MIHGAWLVFGLLIWTAILLLPWRPWSTREHLEAASPPARRRLDDVAVLIPARNEARVIGDCLRALHLQGDGLKIIVVDDQSNDGTSRVVRGHARGSLHDERAGSLVLVSGRPVPVGWSGKVWALEQGRVHLDRPHTLLLDADIALSPGCLPALLDKQRESGAALVSLMARLPTVGAWERLLHPAFIYFFKLLYPFALVNSPSSGVAAAAGGCVLLETPVLERIGGFASLRDELIDDCALGKRVKATGSAIWLGLTHSATSLRGGQRLRDVWGTVARTAFTQLRYSSLLLLACTLLMCSAFVAPFTGQLGDTSAAALGWMSLLMMFISYAPTLRFYDLSVAWGLLLPVAAVLFLAMTWASAIRYWRGDRSRWKGRRYAVSAQENSGLPTGAARH